MDENIKRILFNMGEAKVKCGRENDDIKIMAVTKTVPAQKVNYAVSKGFSLLGENRVQEYMQKRELYAENADVQFIGHLQSNKVKYIIDNVSMIQSVDSVSLAEEISSQAVRHGLVMDILCEVNIGGEESKSGFSPDVIIESLHRISGLEGIKICGLMTIPPPSDSCVHLERMQRLFEDARAARIEGADISLLSMGMSSDYAEAVRFGSNMVRLGTALFGARNYTV